MTPTNRELVQFYQDEATQLMTEVLGRDVNMVHYDSSGTMAIAFPGSIICNPTMDLWCERKRGSIALRRKVNELRRKYPELVSMTRYRGVLNFIPNHRPSAV